jgi:hypothetical protein
MAYEIPQQLQYEEKIIFGLTFKQLIYAIIFGIPALFIFFKTGWNFFIRLGLLVTLVCIGCLFMFFEFSSYMNDFLEWIRFREVWLMQDNMIQFIGIEKIEDGAIYVWKNKKPTKRLSKEERRAISEKISDLRDNSDKLHDKK